MTDSDEVIDWDEAMQQCGEDEEFLRELLDDLRSETDTQMDKMEEIIKVKAGVTCNSGGVQ
jgi:ferritin-like metal-binding protein YciE